jgi:hypothetical protein
MVLIMVAHVGYKPMPLDGLGSKVDDELSPKRNIRFGVRQ